MCGVSRFQFAETNLYTEPEGKWNVVMKRFILLGLLLVMGLSGCGFLGYPSRNVVEAAIALQVEQTQQELTQKLYSTPTEPPKVRVSYVVVRDRELVEIDGLPGYEVKGTYTLMLRFGWRRIISRKNEFDVYLQEDPALEVWSLAQRLPGDEENWQLTPFAWLQ